MTDKEKILQYLDYKGIKKAGFYQETGLSMGFLDSGSSLVVDKLRIIQDSYPDLNIKWFFDDNEPMLISDNHTNYSENNLELNERIRSIRESRKLKKNEFSALIGVDSSQYSKIEAGIIQPTVKLLMEISSRFGVSVDWLLKGTEYNTKNQSLLVAAEPEMPYNSDKTIPLLPVDAYGGDFNGSVQVLKHEVESYIVPVFSGADFLIPVKGNSMYPKYNSGDLVACKRIESWSFFQWGKVYVISTDQGVLIKRVMQATDEGSILLVSEQKDLYPAYELKKSDIHDLGIVLGVIKTE